MAGKVKTWVWVVVAVAVLTVLGFIAVAGAGFYYFSRHIETRAASPARAAEDFDRISSRFTGQKPLIELDEHGRYLRSNTDRQAAPGVKTPTALHVMAFDTNERRLVEVNVPFWILRLKMGGRAITFNGTSMELEDLKLSVQDLERYGPALVVDHQTRDGQRVLVWSE
jgi:hypothetical protein